MHTTTTYNSVSKRSLWDREKNMKKKEKNCRLFFCIILGRANAMPIAYWLVNYHSMKYGIARADTEYNHHTILFGLFCNWYDEKVFTNLQMIHIRPEYRSDTDEQYELNSFYKLYRRKGCLCDHGTWHH